MGASPREKASAEAARTAADRSSALAGTTFPELRDILSRLNADVKIDQGGVGISPSVAKAFDTARAGVNADYAQAGRGQQAQIAQQFKQSGSPYSGAQLNDAMTTSAMALNQNRVQAQNNLNFQESQAGLSQFNNLMNLMGVGSGAALNLGGGFASQQAQAIGDLSNVSRGQGALSGALAGASAGSAAGGYGALIGAVVGGAGGYLSAG